MLELVNVRKTFNPKTVNEKIALDGLNLHLQDGDFMTVIGVMPCASALRTFLLISSFVSLKYSRRSECPRITYFTPASASISGEISPV